MTIVPEPSQNEREDIEALNSIEPQDTTLPSLISNLPTDAEKGAREEKKFYEDQNLRLERLKADGLEQDIKERRVYADKIFKLVSIWLISIFSVIVFQGFSTEASLVKVIFKNAPRGVKSYVVQPKFNLSDRVLLALIGGTTINVIGIFIIVANYLFPKYPQQKNEESKKGD